MSMNTETIFETIWNKYIVPLEGKEVSLFRVKNKILTVNDGGIFRLTSSGNLNQIAKEGFKFAGVTLLATGFLFREDLKPSKNRDSAGILGILSHVPFFERISGRELRLDTSVMEQQLSLRHCEEA